MRLSESRSKIVTGLITLLTSFTGNGATRIIGDHPQVGGLESMCQVRTIRVTLEASFFRFPTADSQIDPVPMPICSGTLIANDQVITAAHCVWEAKTNRLVRYLIECGPNGQLPDGRSTFTDQRWANAIELSSRYDSTQSSSDGDIARITLDSPFPRLHTMEIAQSVSAKDLQILDCEVAGSGRSTVMESRLFLHAPIHFSQSRVIEKLESKGKTISIESTFSAPLSPSNALKLTGLPNLSHTEGKTSFSLRRMNDSQYAVLTNQLQAAFPKNSFFFPGDSGGPLYCRTNARSEYKLYGLNSRNFVFMSNAVPHVLAVHSFWAAPGDTDLPWISYAGLPDSPRE